MNCKGSGGATEFDALTVEVTFKFYNLRTGDAPAPDKGEGGPIQLVTSSDKHLILSGSGLILMDRRGQCALSGIEPERALMNVETLMQFTVE